MDVMITIAGNNDAASQYLRAGIEAIPILSILLLFIIAEQLPYFDRFFFSFLMNFSITLCWFSAS